MRMPAVTRSIAASFVLAVVLCLTVSPVRVPTEAGTAAAPVLRVFYDVMTCAPVFEQPVERARAELTAGIIREQKTVRTWRTNTYDPADCLRLKLEQI